MTAPAALDRITVVGIGSPDRGDDAWGPLVAERVAAATTGDPRVRVVVHEDPTHLVQEWDGTGTAVVLDAVLADGPTGGLVVAELGADSPPLPPGALEGVGLGGTHAFGVAGAIELARALGRLPRRVVVVGVRAGTVGYGAGMSPAVLDAVPEAVATVRRLVVDQGGEP